MQLAKQRIEGPKARKGRDRPTSKRSRVAEILDAFDVTATYNTPNRRLTLTATLDPSLLTAPETQRPPENGRSQMSVVAGAGFEPATFGL
jgi:hypothetical protein